MCRDPLYNNDPDVRKAKEAAVETMREHGFLAFSTAARLVVDESPNLRKVGRSPADKYNIVDKAIDELASDKTKIFARDEQRDGYVPGPKFPSGSKVASDKPSMRTKPVFQAPSTVREQPTEQVSSSHGRQLVDTTVWFSG